MKAGKGDRVLGEDQIRRKYDQVKADKKKMVGGKISCSSCTNQTPARRQRRAERPPRAPTRRSRLRDADRGVILSGTGQVLLANPEVRAAYLEGGLALSLRSSYI
jgi:hypothetical protein